MAFVSNTSSPLDNENSNVNYTSAFVVLTFLFFIWALVTNVNDILIPHLKKACDLNDFQSSFVQSAFFGAYFVMSIPSGFILQKIGYKNGIVVGLVTMMVGALLFVPAAATLSYPAFLIALFTLGSGITLLQVAANPYVSLLGKPETASTRLNLAQGFNSIGAALGPFIGGLLILSGVEIGVSQWASMSDAQQLAYRQAEASAVIMPYIGLAITLALLALLIFFFKLPAIQFDTNQVTETETTSANSVWEYRHLTLGVVAIFAYVGAEVSIGSFLIRFAGLPEIAGLNEKAASIYPSFYMLGAMVGRFAGSAIMTKVDPRKALTFNAVLALAFVATAIFTKGYTALIALTLVGLCNSILFPTIFTLGISRLGKFTHQGSSYLIMAIFGGAVLPPVTGLVSDLKGIQFAFIVPLLCYLYIAYYGASGSKVKLPGSKAY